VSTPGEDLALGLFCPPTAEPRGHAARQAARLMYTVEQPPLPGQQPPGLPPRHGSRPGATTGLSPAMGPRIWISQPGKASWGLQVVQEPGGGEDVGGQPREKVGCICVRGQGWQLQGRHGCHR
jgi:hypothetical protein